MAITIPNTVWVAPLGTDNFVELTPYIAYQGVKWSLNGVEAASTGRTQDSILHLDRVGAKVRLDISCRPLSADDMKTVLQAIIDRAHIKTKVWLRVKYFDPWYGGIHEAKMYTNNISAQFLKMNADGTSYWQGLQFPFVEQ